MRKLGRFLAEAPNSQLRKFTAAGADIDEVIDVRAVFQQDSRALALETLPASLQPRKGKLDLVDYEKMFCADPRGGRDIFDLRGIDRQQGAS